MVILLGRNLGPTLKVLVLEILVVPMMFGHPYFAVVAWEVSSMASSVVSLVWKGSWGRALPSCAP